MFFFLSYFLEVFSLTYHSKYSIQSEVHVDVSRRVGVQHRPHRVQVKDRSQSLKQAGLVRIGTVHLVGAAQSW